jgi:hypothetical protein
MISPSPKYAVRCNAVNPKGFILDEAIHSLSSAIIASLQFGDLGITTKEI